MADLAAIRAAIAAALDADTAATGVSVYDHVRPSPSLPAVHTGALTSIEYHYDYGSGARLRMTVTLEHAREDPRRAQRWFDLWLSKPGPLTRLEKAVSAEWVDLTVVSASAPRALGDPASGEVASLAVDVTVEITT